MCIYGDSRLCGNHAVLCTWSQITAPCTCFDDKCSNIQSLSNFLPMKTVYVKLSSCQICITLPTITYNETGNRVTVTAPIIILGHNILQGFHLLLFLSTSFFTYSVIFLFQVVFYVMFFLYYISNYSLLTNDYVTTYVYIYVALRVSEM